MVAVMMKPLSIGLSPSWVLAFWVVSIAAIVLAAKAAKPSGRMVGATLFALGVAAVIVWDCSWLWDWLCWAI